MGNREKRKVIRERKRVAYEPFMHMGQTYSLPMSLSNFIFFKFLKNPMAIFIYLSFAIISYLPPNKISSIYINFNK